jgi:hypothetical protein
LTIVYATLAALGPIPLGRVLGCEVEVFFVIDEGGDDGSCGE